MKVLFAFAHPDDESFGPCCTIQKYANAGHDVIVASMCDGSRPGAEYVASARQQAFVQTCALLGAEGVIAHNPDLTMSYTDVVNYAVDLISIIRPDVVYTNNISDVNADHRLLAEACMIACRPKPTSTVKTLRFCEIPGSTDWGFGQLQPAFFPTVFVDVSDMIDIKTKVISLYSTETYAFPDARSAESSITLAKRRGSQVGISYAEAFSTVFTIE